MPEPFYIINFSASACLFEIRVNDIAVIHMNIEGQAATHIPINNAIFKSGKQQITSAMLPLLGEAFLDPEAQLKYTVNQHDTANDFMLISEELDYTTPEITKHQKLPVAANAAFFMATVPFSFDILEKAETLKKDDSTLTLLKDAYSSVRKLLIDKRYDEFKTKLQNRESRIAASLYLSKAESNARLNDLVKDFQSGFEVMPFPHDAIMVLSAHGKFAELKKLNGESALFLYNKETDEELIIDINFFIPKGKREFEVI